MALHLLHVRVEPHRQHAVCFIEHTHLQLVERERAAEQEVEHTPRGPDDELRAVLERVDLGTVANAAVHRDRAQPGAGTDNLCRLPDLLRQLPCRHEHERLAVRLVRLQALQHREQERSGLSAAGPGLHHHVATREQAGKRLALDRHERGPTGAGGAGLQGFGQLIEGQIRKLIRVDGLGGVYLFGQHASI